MATATPSCRCGWSAGWSSASFSKSCLTDVAEIWNSATPPVTCARLPTSTTRAKTSGLRGDALLAERLENSGRGHRQLGEADAGGLLHRVGDGAQRRDDRRLADAAHAVRVLGVADLDDDRVDHRHIRGDGHAVVEEPGVLQLAVGAVDVFLVQRP